MMWSIIASLLRRENLSPMIYYYTALRRLNFNLNFGIILKSVIFSFN